MLGELTQRNLFCTYFSQENVDSLLHPANLAYRQEVIWNLRFASILGFTMNLKEYIMDDNKLELVKSMNLSLPYITVSVEDLRELRLMLNNQHDHYENDRFYPPESQERLEFILNYYSGLELSSKDSSSYYKCDSCGETVMFPLLIPCPKIHLACVYCIMDKHGYRPVPVDFSLEESKHEPAARPGQGPAKKTMYYWKKRGPINFCVVCGKHCGINSDFFDRIQVPIQISYIELNNKGSNSTHASGASPAPSVNTAGPSVSTGKNKSAILSRSSESSENVHHHPIFDLPLISRLRALLTKSYKSNEIEANLKELYLKFSDITVCNINNYLVNYLNSFKAASSPQGENQSTSSSFMEIYSNIPFISIGLISLSSSKLRYVLHRILMDTEENSGIKIMVVSSFWQQLDLLYYTLTILFDVGTCRYYPHISKSELTNSISNFKGNSRFQVLLLSIDIGSHGLDLSCVTNVYILDPIADESIEKQTISRAYRIRTPYRGSALPVPPESQNPPADSSSSESPALRLSEVNVTYCLKCKAPTVQRATGKAEKRLAWKDLRARAVIFARAAAPEKEGGAARYHRRSVPPKVATLT
ncbi:SWI2/SNF2-containing protein [Cryptosporidium felis]|nr:SWI2/SNF2-containing protein [Cryptosporidium felis]